MGYTTIYEEAQASFTEKNPNLSGISHLSAPLMRLSHL